MYIWCPNETLFILHHWATLLYMTTVLVLGTGDLSCCLCIFLGYARVLCHGWGREGGAGGGRKKGERV